MHSITGFQWSTAVGGGVPYVRWPGIPAKHAFVACALRWFSAGYGGGGRCAVRQMARDPSKACIRGMSDVNSKRYHAGPAGRGWGKGSISGSLWSR